MVAMHRPRALQCDTVLPASAQGEACGLTATARTAVVAQRRAGIAAAAEDQPDGPGYPPLRRSGGARQRRVEVAGGGGVVALVGVGRLGSRRLHPWRAERRAGLTARQLWQAELAAILRLGVGILGSGGRSGWGLAGLSTTGRSRRLRAWDHLGILHARLRGSGLGGTGGSRAWGRLAVWRGVNVGRAAAWLIGMGLLGRWVRGKGGCDLRGVKGGPRSDGGVYGVRGGGGAGHACRQQTTRKACQ